MESVFLHTEKLVFSFADIAIYKKVQNNLNKDKVPYIEFTPETMDEFAKGISEIKILP